MFESSWRAHFLLNSSLLATSIRGTLIQIVVTLIQIVHASLVQTMKMGASSKPRTKGGKGGLNDVLTKQLLQEFEALNINREDLDLLGFCNNDTSTWGLPASDRRIQVQSRWELIKRKSPTKYVNYLRKFGLFPNSATLEELSSYEQNESKIMPSSDEEQTAVTEVTELTEAVSSMEEEEEAEIDEVKNAIINAMKNPNHTPFRSPMAKKKNAMVIQSPPPKNDYAFGKVAALGGGKQGMPAAVIQWLLSQNGSEQCPWTFLVNLDYPEAHGFFEVLFVTGRRHRKWKRDLFHIRVPTSAFDWRLCKAFIPHDGIKFSYPSSYQKRLVIIRLPSNPFVFRKSKHFHAGKAFGGNLNSLCPQLKDRQKTTQINIEKDDERRWQWYLFVFPEDIKLDNMILNDEEATIKTDPNGITIPKMDPDNSFNMDVKEMTVFWEIAVEGGEQIEEEDEGPKNVDLF